MKSFLSFSFMSLIKGAVDLGDQLVLHCCLQYFFVGNKLDLIIFTLSLFNAEHQARKL